MKRFFIVISFAVLFITSSFAQEGMWLLSQINQLDLKSKGLQIETKDIYDPSNPSLVNAILQLDGGSASFVSPEGLVVTNHHVGYAALQRSSSKDHDYITNGFLAMNKSEEMQAPGYVARSLIKMKDVTDEILPAVQGITEPNKYEEAVNKKINEMTDEIEKGKDDIDATVAEMYNGKQYVLFVYKTFHDIRIVYAPPLSIGNYGGEIDNWMWPRHTGDFTFVRVYVSPDGKGSNYSPDNVPYKPKVWLKVAKTNLKDGDLTFIMGFPGFTTRYRTSNSVAWNMKYNYPFTIKQFGDVINLMDELTKDSPEGQIKVANLKKGLANTMKNYEGKLEGMTKSNFLQKKIQFEKELMEFINSKPELKAKYGDILDNIKEQYSILLKTKDKSNLLNYYGFLSGTLSGIGYQIYQTAKEREKPEDQRLPGYSDKAIQQRIDGLRFQYGSYYEPVDKALLVRYLKKAAALPEDQKIKGLDYILNADNYMSIEQFVDKAYGESKLSDPEYAKKLFSMSLSDLKNSNDPFIKLAINITPELGEIQQINIAFGNNITELRKRYIDAVYEWKGKTLYPDANGTIRFTWGYVKGYSPRDAVWYKPFTTLKGVVEKNTGEVPFNMPEKLGELYANKDFGNWEDPKLGDVPVAFLNQCDITGGNSGSPVMNAKGELVGLAFDGDYEALIGDWQYDAEKQRTISVDINYVLFITDKFAHAENILKEMGVAD